MASLSNVRPSIGHVAAQDLVANAFAGVVSLFGSFSRALAFSRMCEVELNRTGEIAPETLKRLLDQV